MVIAKPGVYGKNELRLGEVARQVVDAYVEEAVGAVALFVGKVKAEGRDGKKVSRLEIEAYKEHADKAIARICSETQEKYGLRFAGVWHLIGVFKVGDPLVLVAAAGKSRREVFQALVEMVERYKREPALFKKEIYVDGSYRWLEE